jgi:hypothetical protein
MLVNRLLIKLRLKLNKWTYRNLNLEVKFNIGDIVVPISHDAFSPFQDFFPKQESGEVVDIYMGSKMHQHQDWYYVVVFTDDSVIPPYNKARVDFNHWEIKLDKAYLRDKKIKELGL